MILRSRTLLLVALCCTLGAAAEPDARFERWQKEIAAIQERDAQQKLPLGTTVFVGSSSIRLWDLKRSFPEKELANHGFGGSTIADSVHFVQPLVLALKPKTIVFYAGDNDVSNGLSPEQVHADFEAFVKAVHEALPESKIAFIAIKPSPARWKLFEKQQAANQLIQQMMAKDAERLVYIDIVTPMLGEDGQPRRELFEKDLLHLNETGYALWTRLVLPVLK